jgi:hypothetical protein
MTVYLYWADPGFPRGPEHFGDAVDAAHADLARVGESSPGGDASDDEWAEHAAKMNEVQAVLEAARFPRANTRRAAFSTVDEAYEQAAHDVAFHGAEITHLTDDAGSDVLEHERIASRVAELRYEHEAPLRSHLKALQDRLEVA